MQSLPEGSGPVLLKRHVVVSLNKCPWCRQLNPVSIFTAAECARVTLTPQAERRTTLLEALYAVGSRRRCTLGAVGAPGHSRMFPSHFFQSGYRCHTVHTASNTLSTGFMVSQREALRGSLSPTSFAAAPRPGLVGQVSHLGSRVYGSEVCVE